MLSGSEASEGGHAARLVSVDASLPLSMTGWLNGLRGRRAKTPDS